MYILLNATSINYLEPKLGIRKKKFTFPCLHFTQKCNAPPPLPAPAHFNIALPITNLEGLMGFHGCFGKPVNRDISNFDPREARFKLAAEKGYERIT